MADNQDHDRAGTMSVKDMQGWLKEEIRDSSRAHDLRVKGATEFVTAYAEGKLTPRQATEHLIRHDQRWGEALLGTTATPGKSDEQILAEIDHANAEALNPKPFSTSARERNLQGGSGNKSR